MHVCGQLASRLLILSAMASDSQSVPRPQRIRQSQMATLERVGDRFVRDVASDFAMLMRVPVQGSVKSVEEVPVKTLLGSLSPAACYGVMATGAESGLIYMAPELVAVFVETLLGGNSAQPMARRGEMTALEQMLLEGTLKDVVSRLRAGWTAEWGELDLQVSALLSDLRFARFDAHSTMVAFTCSFAIGATEGTIIAALPIRLAVDKGEKTPAVGEEQQKNLLALLGGTRLRFEVELPGPAVRVADLTSLRPGDVLTFGKNVDDALTASVNGQSMYSGHILVQNGRRCFQVEGI